MATRRQAREWALQMLFQLDHNPAKDLEPAFVEFWKQQAMAHSEDNEGRANRPDTAANADAGLASPKIQAFTERVVRGVVQNREAIDKRLTEYVKNWPLHRMGGIERNVMRLAFYELFFEEETPPIVCINEAVDLAKYFSNAEAGRFVNGILDRAAKEVKRPARKQGK
jgi:N utilization substance protein B